MSTGRAFASPIWRAETGIIRPRTAGREAAFYEKAEREWLRRFESIYVAWAVERADLLSRIPGLPVYVLPNTIPLPAAAVDPLPHSEYTLLFTGNLSYYPNEDAIQFFLTEVLPLIASRGVRHLIVGRGASTGLRELMARAPAVTAMGYVKDLAGVYEMAGAAIVPIRAGGGTRIKILRAFARGIPVISTAIGAEGLEVGPCEHFLPADSPADFAAACVCL